MLKPLTMDGLAAELKAIHEKIDARLPGLRQADSTHTDRAALIIPRWPVMKCPRGMWRRACMGSGRLRSAARHLMTAARWW